MSIHRAASASALLAACVLTVAAIVPSASAYAAQSSSHATCSSLDRPAAVGRMFSPLYPTLASELGLDGTAIVRVALAPSGKLSDVALAHSSGFGSLDKAALAATRDSTFTAETVACAAVPGEYLVEVRFEQ